MTGLGAQERGWAATLSWLQEEGSAQDLGDARYQDPERRLDAREHVQQVLAEFAAERTMEELMDGGQRRHLFVMPMFTAREIARDPHLHARDFYTEVHHPDLDATLTYPGAPYRLSETPWCLSRRAPRLGEHNLEIYHGELDIPVDRLALLKAAGAI